jgi:predicted DNA-binding protein (UPF0251 family)
MNREDIIRLAREAGGTDRRTGWWDIHTDDLERFAALVAAHEREACAKVCEVSRSKIWDYHDEALKETAKTVCDNLAAAIRARGQDA